MYDVLKAKPDLIVLDDPISSFDKNKKYAIIDMLFRKEKSLRGKTG
jgi:ABC-type molybdate transport system ATPase subunit